jgi:hypothetical protein
VTYSGTEPTTRAVVKNANTEARELRRKLEDLHLGQHPNAVDEAWPYLGHSDRFVRHAARTALEHQPLETWQQRALDESDLQTSLTALLALVRKIPRAYKPPSGADLDTPPPIFPATDATRHALQPQVLAALERFDWSQLADEQRHQLLRIYALALYRLGPPDEKTRIRLSARLDEIYPATQREMDGMLTELLCYLQAPTAAEKGAALLATSPTQEGQLDLARSLRFLETGWNLDTRRKLFQWFNRAQAYRGGNNFRRFIDELKKDSLARMPEQDRAALADVIDAPVPSHVTPTTSSRYLTRASQSATLSAGGRCSPPRTASDAIVLTAKEVQSGPT